MGKFAGFARIAETEFSDIVISTHDLGHKLRIYLKDKSFIDFFYTEKLKERRFSIHWERYHIDNTFYRLDNTPDPKWKKVKTFPEHFHFQKYNQVDVPPFPISSLNLKVFFREFLNFARNKLQT